jgi:protein-S-isoprenylcysteine O-methyltransferase Ste14
MTRRGIGPKFSVISVLFGVLVGLLTYLYPEHLMIESIPYWLLAILGTGLLVVGTMVYVNSLRKFNVGYRPGELVTTGPYAVVRHPIYAAWILLICPGCVLFLRSWPMLSIPLVAYIGFKVLIHQEDACLENKFGQEYLDYQSKVNEFFPSWEFWLGILDILMYREGRH